MAVAPVPIFRREVDHLGRRSPTAAPSRASSDPRSEASEPRIGAGLVAAAVTVAAIVFLGKVFAPVGRGEPAAPAVPGGRILYADASSEGLAAWFTVRPDGTAVRDLGIETTCAVWYPDGSGILITNDDAAGPPLRPAVVDPDGSNLRPSTPPRTPT